MSWNLEGSYFETCSCDVVCPCTASFALPATHERCRVTLVFNVEDGEVDGTDVSGLTVAAVADTPKVMTDGNWRLGVFIDAAATDEQAEMLGAVFSGALGGPMQALAPLVGENLGVERAPIVVQEEGLRHSIRIGDAVDFEIEDVVPFGSATGEPARLTGIFHPAGSDLTVAHATRSKIDAFGIQYEGNSAFSRSSFSWAGMSAVASRALENSSSDRSELGAAFAAVRARLGLVVVLLLLAALAWWSTADRMAGMDAGPGTALGALGWFLGVWVVMMAAMMFPALAPTAALYATMTRRHGQSRAVLFAGSYLLVWGAAGVVAYGLFELGNSLFGGALAWRSGGRWVAAGVLVAAAAYELTPLKDACLAKCRSPLGFLLGSWRDGAVGARADGLTARGVVPGVLLGADGRAVRARGHESRVDGVDRRADRAREDPPVAADGDLGHGGDPGGARGRGPRVPALGPGAHRSGRLARGRDELDELDAVAPPA